MRTLLFNLIFVSCLSVYAASTNLNYTTAQISSALGYAIANTNTPARCTAMEGSIVDMNSAVDDMQSVVAAYTNDTSSVSRAQIVFSTALVADDFLTASDTTYETIDLSGNIGSNAALVFLSVAQTGSVVNAEFRARHPDVTLPVVGGVGMVTFLDVTPPKSGLVVCSADTNGCIEASSPEGVDVTLCAFIREVE